MLTNGKCAVVARNDAAITMRANIMPVHINRVFDAEMCFIIFIAFFIRN